MNLNELEQRWKSIKGNTNSPYTSLRINAECIPDLFLSIDVNGNRFLILTVPKEIQVQCLSQELENLSLEWHEETRYILIGLLNKQFNDLFNELTLSLYSKIKHINNASEYSKEFIAFFHKWSHFFDNSSNIQLSENEIKGLFGEIVVLRYCLKNSQNIDTNSILKAWQGPYKGIQDFVFLSNNIEVKTKEVDKVTIRISNETQLQASIEKDLELAIVDVTEHNDGYSISNLINELKVFILELGGDITIFLDALAKTNIRSNDLGNYDLYKWNPIRLTFYNYNKESGAPRITALGISSAINNVEYNISVALLENFINKRILL